MSCLPCLLSPWTGIIRRSHRIPSVYAASIYRDVTKIALTPPPRHITLPSSPRLDATSPRYLSSHLPPPSRSSSRSSFPPRKLSRGFSPTFTPSLRLYPRSISNDTSKHQNLSLSSFLYLPLSIRLSPPRRFSIPRRFTKISLSKSTNCDEEIKKKKKKEKSHVARAFSFTILLR